MSYHLFGAVSASPAMVLQTTLKNLGYLKGSVDGIVGPQTMAACVAIARDAVTDFAGSINAAGGTADARAVAVGGMKGVQNKLSAAQSGGGFSGDFASLQAAQTKLKDEWSRWIRAGGRGPTDRAAAFTSMTLVKPGTTSRPSGPEPVAEEAPPPVAVVAPPKSKKGLLLAGAGVAGVAALIWAMSQKGE